MKKSILFVFACLSLIQAAAQVPVSLMPQPCPQFFDVNGKPLAGGRIFTYAAGTTTPQATYTNSAGTVANTNPIVLNAGGFPGSLSGACGIWLSQNTYKIVVQSSLGVQQWVVDNVSDPGFFYTTKAVLLAPTGGALQTITGPLAAAYLNGTTLHVTSTGVRVSYLDPATVLDTATNPPNLLTNAPLAANQNYRIPDPGGHANFVMNPDPSQAGTNTLDCTQAGITCKRTAYFYLEGGGCNNATAGLGWDTFPTNSPTPYCVTGTNIQKGVLAFPGAATRVQENTGTGAASATCTTTYPAATIAGHLLEVEVAVDGGKTVTGVTDGTNAYTKAVSVANGNTDLEIWYFNGNSTAMVAGSTVTVSLSAAANCALNWKEYAGIVTASLLDKTATNTGTGTAVTTGTTVGTSQNVELILAAVASPSNPSVSTQTGWTGHTEVSQSTNVSVFSQGKVQQATTTQSGAMTLGSSQAWAAAVATFNVSVAGPATAQRQIALPAYFLASAPINSAIKWHTPQTPTGTVQSVLGAAVVCTADGSSDDPAFNTATTATVTVSQTGPVITTTPLNSLAATGCAASNLLHYQIERLRYNASDTFEGYIYVEGASLQFGITQ